MMWTTELKEDLDNQGLVIINKDQLAQLKKDKDQFFNEKLELEQEVTDLRERLAGTWNEKDLWRIIKDLTQKNVDLEKNWKHSLEMERKLAIEIILLKDEKSKP